MFRKWRSENRISDSKFENRTIPKASDRVFGNNITK